MKKKQEGRLFKEEQNSKHQVRKKRIEGQVANLMRNYTLMKNNFLD